MMFRIEGEKINLRRIRKSDAVSLAEHANHKDVAPAVGSMPFPYKIEDAYEFIRLQYAWWRKKEQCQFGIEDPSTGEIVGMIGLMNIKNDVKKTEVGYWLGKKYWGGGLAKEALSLALDYAFKELKLNRVYARVSSLNVPSAKLLEKKGFTLEGKLREHTKFKGKFCDELWYGILKDEYKG